jgi:hypothetical protein
MHTGCVCVDFTDPAIVDAWVENINGGNTVNLLAEAEDEIVGYGSLSFRCPAQRAQWFGKHREPALAQTVVKREMQD